MRKDLLPARDLESFLTSNNDKFINANGMKIVNYQMKYGLCTSLIAVDFDKSPIKVEIITEGDGFQDFIEAFRIKNLNDIHQLNFNNSWMRYLNGSAQIIYSPMELEASIYFKIAKWKTMVYSLELHFYDEVYEHLTMPEDFYKYLDTHEKQIQVASLNRYKF